MQVNIHFYNTCSVLTLPLNKKTIELKNKRFLSILTSSHKFLLPFEHNSHTHITKTERVPQGWSLKGTLPFASLFSVYFFLYNSLLRKMFSLRNGTSIFYQIIWFFCSSFSMAAGPLSGRPGFGPICFGLQFPTNQHLILSDRPKSFWLLLFLK